MTRAGKQRAARKVKKKTARKTAKKRAKAGTRKSARSGKTKGMKKVAKRKTAKKAKKKAARRKTAAKARARKAVKKKAAKKVKKKVARKKAAKKKVARKKTVKKKTAKKTVAKKTSASAKASAKKATRAVLGGKAGPAKPAEPPVKKPPRPSYTEILARLPYREGSFVVHPKYGLGKVDRVVERRLSTGVVPCMEIGFPYQEMKLTIPVDQVERSGLRQPIGKREISDVFRVLKGRATFDAKRRSAKRVVDYRKRLSQGDPTSLAEAVRDLARLSLRKSLSYEERKILSTALRILSREVALARGREADDVREEIESIVYR